ncbi:MAG: N-6 DNA methylase, partial [Gemmataceae bacterium]
MPLPPFPSWALLLSCAWPSPAERAHPSRADVVRAMRPYGGPTLPGVDRSTLTGKVVCGYQGWFTAPDDAAGLGWRHYPNRGRFEPGRCCIDLWPDVGDLDDDEKYPTPFRHADGRVAHVFSSHNRKTVLRHFHWMKEYGLDGVFVQRFAVETVQPLGLRHCNTVLAHCREGANLHGRGYAVMYDLSGLPEGGVGHVIEDWKLLVARMKIGRDAAHLRHGGKPVVAVWGVGFNDGRRYTLAECERLVDFLKNDKEYGGFTVLLGVPTGLRTLDADSVKDAALHRVVGQADIISPWTVGRFRTLDGVGEHARKRWKEDIQWCQKRGKEYLPVVFPGFSWHNLRPRSPLDEIPRLKGRFLWKQFVEAKAAGATMLYQAMFDEMDDGTAIFKCTNDPPVGKSRFLTLEGLPSDHYLWLVGAGGKLLRGEIKATEALPPRGSDRGGQGFRGSRAMTGAAERIGEAYQRRLSSAARRSAGAHYTPPGLAEQLTRLALAPLADRGDVLGLRVCDPACGCGAFLLAACRYLAGRLAEQTGTSLREALRLVAESCLFGVDKDACAVELARRSLRRLSGSEAQFDHAVRQGDALLGFDWAAEFPEVTRRGGFDAALTNPPFVNAIDGDTPDAVKGRLRRRYPLLTGAADLAYYFVVLAHELVRGDGSVGLVLPRPFLGAPSARRLRAELLARRPPSAIWLPDGARLFDAANVRVAAVVLNGGPPALRSEDWWELFAPPTPRDGNSPATGDRFEVFASMTAGMAYDLLPFLSDSIGGDGPRLVTTGLIDPEACRWGETPCRYLKRVFAHPRIVVGPGLPAALRRRVERTGRPKVLVAGVAGPGGRV